MEGEGDAPEDGGRGHTQLDKCLLNVFVKRFLVEVPPRHLVRRRTSRWIYVNNTSAVVSAPLHSHNSAQTSIGNVFVLRPGAPRTVLISVSSGDRRSSNNL